MDAHDRSQYYQNMPSSHWCLFCAVLLKSLQPRSNILWHRYMFALCRFLSIFQGRSQSFIQENHGVSSARETAHPSSVFSLLNIKRPIWWLLSKTYKCYISCPQIHWSGWAIFCVLYFPYSVTHPPLKEFNKRFTFSKTSRVLHNVCGRLLYFCDCGLLCGWVDVSNGTWTPRIFKRL